LVVDLVAIVLDVVALTAVLSQANFAFQTLRIMRKGMLEKAWWYTSTGAILLSIGIGVFIVQNLYLTAETARFANYLGTIVLIVGSSATMIGFLGQYQFWKPPEK
jgi:protein-S-isoprenylcysteine O-methyltransferase Ste14